MAAKKVENVSHALFWSLIKNIEGYCEAYKETIKESIVFEHSGEKTTSLSEMWNKYPKQYCKMLEALKGDSRQRNCRYEENRDKLSKRTIAAICSWLDKQGYEYPSPAAKIAYAKVVACRAASCGSFNKIPESKLTAIYNLYCKYNRVGAANPALDLNLYKN